MSFHNVIDSAFHTCATRDITATIHLCSLRVGLSAAAKMMVSVRPGSSFFSAVDMKRGRTVLQKWMGMGLSVFLSV